MTALIAAGCLVAIVNFGIRSAFGFFTVPISDAHGWPRDLVLLDRHGSTRALRPAGTAELGLRHRHGLGFIWVVSGEEPGLAGRLVREGAIGAYRELPVSPTIAGCFALADAKAASFLP